MDLPQIEYLIAEAIKNRPRVTIAAMNLYIHNGRLVCGARIVMPEDAIFITHVTPYQLEDGFSDKEWKLIAEKTKNIVGTARLVDKTAGQAVRVTSGGIQSRTEMGQRSFRERRREQRLRYRHPIWFARDYDDTFSKGQMVDVSSGGIAFTCHSDGDCPLPGQRITTRFKVPRFKVDDSFETMSFSRPGRICRVEKMNGFLERVAVQFAQPLPFKPGEQGIGETNVQQGLGAVKR